MRGKAQAVRTVRYPKGRFAVNNRSYENLSDKRVNKVVGLFELPTEIPLKLRKHNTAVIYTLDNIKN